MPNNGSSDNETEEKKYQPYRSRDEVIAEYNSLRAEIMESQKQRIAVITGFLALIAVLLSYLLKNEAFDAKAALILIFLTIPVTGSSPLVTT